MPGRAPCLVFLAAATTLVGVSRALPLLSPDPAGAQLHRMFSGVAGAARRIRSSGGTPTIVHIGVDGLANDDAFTDVDLYNRLDAVVPVHDFRMAFVDPSENKNPSIWEHMKRTRLDAGKTQIKNGLVMGRCNSSTTTMYFFSPRLVQRDFGVPMDYAGWQTTDPERPVRVLKYYAQMKSESGDKYAKSWVAFAQAGNLTSYLDHRTFRCFAPAALLRELGVEAGDVAMLIVDAEGEDTPIVNSFVRLPRFQPGSIQFEVQWDSNPEDVPLKKSLVNSGYNVGGGAEPGNVLATLPG